MPRKMLDPVLHELRYLQHTYEITEEISITASALWRALRKLLPDLEWADLDPIPPFSLIFHWNTWADQGPYACDITIDAPNQIRAVFHIQGSSGSLHWKFDCLSDLLKSSLIPCLQNFKKS